MTQDQFDKLIDYIDAAINNRTSSGDGLHESVAKHRKHEELYDSFFKESDDKDYIIKSFREENSIISALIKETSEILQKRSNESVPDAARRIIKEREEYLAFFKNLLDPEMYGWAVNEEVRNEAREFLGIPKVKKKK